MPDGRGASPRTSRPPPSLDTRCALFLDIDGTLLEIAATPAQVRVDPELLRLLPALERTLGGAIALITGRAIDDVDRLFPGLGLPVAGQHGCERRAADGTRHRHAPAPAGVDRLRGRIRALAARHAGLRLEDKDITFALHYRQAPRLAGYVHRAARAMLDEALAAGAALQLIAGKRVVEFVPDGRDKGTAILEYLGEPPFAGRRAVFIGDDRTDELGFAAVRRRRGWAVKVGGGTTHAQFRLPDVASVRAWLASMPTPSALLRNPLHG
jgi:trehalose 6-phosphate phosphatase